MQFEFALEVPANTARADALEWEVQLAPGIITHVEIEFPAGCAGLAHVQIDYLEHQVWPTTPGDSFSSNGYAIGWDAEFLLDDLPYVMTLRAWNEDDLFTHTPRVRFTVGRATLSWMMRIREQWRSLFGEGSAL